MEIRLGPTHSSHKTAIEGTQAPFHLIEAAEQIVRMIMIYTTTRTAHSQSSCSSAKPRRSSTKQPTSSGNPRSIITPWDVRMLSRGNLGSTFLNDLLLGRFSRHR